MMNDFLPKQEWTKWEEVRVSQSTLRGDSVRRQSLGGPGWRDFPEDLDSPLPPPPSAHPRIPERDQHVDRPAKLRTGP